MDSMKSLNTSLPRTSTFQQQQPSSELLSSFKAAALSVTTLYKLAAADQARARAAGYQDALEDLLSFLEQDRIGFTDGEGSRVRQWAIERIDGNRTARQESDDDEEEVAEDDKLRASSPEDCARTSRTEEPARIDANTTHVTGSTSGPQPPRDFAVPRDQSTFSFRSSHAYPSNHDREPSNHDRDPSNSDGHDRSTVTQRPLTNQPVRLELGPRANRHRPSRSITSRCSISSRLGSVAGTKRRQPLGEFFDIGGLGLDPKDFERPCVKQARHA